MKVAITSLLFSIVATASLATEAGGVERLREPQQHQLQQHHHQQPQEEQRSLQDTDDDPDDGGIDLADIFGIGCFPEDATVQVEHKEEPVWMKDLKIGDRVWTTHKEYASVYTFGHRLPEKDDIFVQLETQEGDLQLTGEHLVYLNGQSNPVRADSVEPGQVLQQAETTTGATVFATSLLIRKGVYAPFTTTGTIVVNGKFAASSYISLQQQAIERVEFSNGWQVPFLSHHRFIHLGLSPLRMACLGVSSSFCDVNNPQGMPHYLTWLLSFQQFAERQFAWVQCIMLTLYLVVMGFCMVLEGTVGPAEAPAAIAVVGLVYLLLKHVLRLQLRVKIIAPRRRT